MRRASPLLLCALGLTIAGCRGEIAGTATITKSGQTAEAKVQSTGKKLVVWADLDGKWEGSKSSKMDVRYDIDILQNKTSIAKLTCSTQERAGTSVCGSHTNVMGSHDADCEILLGCVVPSLPPGEVIFRVTATTGPNVTSVKKISLNVRGG